MASLPETGDTNWGDTLNEYLSISHDSEGRHKDIVNVRDFGAHSITEVGFEDFDSTSALQNAINASEYKSLYIPTGKYKITSSLELDGTKGYNIYGDGWDKGHSISGSIIKNAGDGTNTINITTAGTGTTAIDQEFNMIRLSDFMLLGTFSGTPSGSGIVAQNVHKLYLDRMVIKSHGGSGITLTNGYGFKMNNCIVGSNGNHGVKINKRGDQMVIQGCTIAGNARNGVFANLKLAMDGGVGGADENLAVLVIGNDFSLPAAAGSHCVSVQNTLNLTFIGNYAERSLTGYLFISDSTCRNLVIDGNYFQDGKFLLNKSINSRVTNNTFRTTDGTVYTTNFAVSADAGDGTILVRGNRLVNGATETFVNFTPFPRGQLGDNTTWNPIEIANGSSLDSHNIEIIGATLGDITFASLEVDLKGLVLTSAVTETNTVVCTLTNNTGASVILPESALNIRILKI